MMAGSRGGRGGRGVGVGIVYTAVNEAYVKSAEEDRSVLMAVDELRAESAVVEQNVSTAANAVIARTVEVPR